MANSNGSFSLDIKNNYKSVNAPKFTRNISFQDMHTRILKSYSRAS